jgi:segregation and condensation protein B
MELKYLLESLFFVSTKSLDLKELATFLKKDISEVEMALKELTVEYQENNRGLRIIESGRKYQMASTPDNAKLVQDFLQTEISGELTPASLETLTIIAYRGPIKKTDLEKIRGINCSLILRNLLIRGLIEQKTDKNDDDNEYVVSLEFIKFLGLSGVKDLPDYEKFNNSEDIDRLLGKIELPIDAPDLFNKETE